MFSRSSIKLSLFTILMSTCVVGCMSTSKDEAQDSDSQETNKFNYAAQEGLTSTQRFNKALEHLQYGRVEMAEAELTEYIKQVPRSKRAKSLLEQINMDPEQYFPDEYFTVKLTSGESLSTLSSKYLGSALSFYSLAKYNDIKNPSRVNIGQKINIPLTEKAKLAKAKEAELAAAPKQEDVAVVKEAPDALPVEAAQTEELVAQAKETIQSNDTPEAPRLATPEEVSAELASLVASKDYESAVSKVTTLKEFGALTYESRDVAIDALIGNAAQIAESDMLTASAQYFEAGQFQLMNGDEVEALSSFTLASELDPSNTQALEDMTVLKKDITEKYHREASSAYRRQELDTAIAKWDQLLLIDPEHNSAKLHRAQAIELKERLNKLKK